MTDCEHLEYVAIDRGFRAAVNAPFPAISHDLQALVDFAWSEAVSVPDRQLFDGQVVYATGFDNNILACTIGPYRYFYAQMVSPELRERIALPLVAVSGLIVHSGNIVLGVRAKSVTQFPQYLELVPSGSVSASCAASGGQIDYTGQLVSEFAEELSLPAASIADVVPFALISDWTAAVRDICCRIVLREDTTLATLQSPTGEYEEFVLVPC